MKINSINVNGCSICAAGKENYTTFRPAHRSKQVFYQYDYRTPGGKLFSVVAPTLEECRTRRDEWLKAQDKEEKKQVKICSCEDASHSVELFNFMKENGFEDVYDLFQSDTEILRINDAEICFVEVDINKVTTFVIYLDTEYKATENEINTLLQHFYADNFKDYFTKLDSNWTIFRSLCNGIAYRGGQGTTYTIWKYYK